MKKGFPTVAKTTLILIYFVIVAGALVRMTGSGMGCPDWPKCFGYYIPPTDIKELTWAPNRAFEEGQVIIRDEALLVANADFTTGNSFDQSQWRPYTKHDYAIFNPTHTWIEYLNRLAGALAGVSTFVMAILSFGYWRTNRKITLLSWLAVFLMGFQGWLGATVVYSVLNPIKITIHMLVALGIVALVLYLIHGVQKKQHNLTSSRKFNGLLMLALLLTLIQVFLGTQVRQFVDEQSSTAHGNLIGSLNNPPLNFYIHRTFSILVFLVNVYLVWVNAKLGLGYKNTRWILALILLEIITGFVMYYFDFPFGFQSAHLVLAAVLFGIQFYVWLEAKSVKSLDRVNL
ncbi:MAG TPA: COX15/CtaA family protein [Flavobacterium sp.]|jgi:cytochrome c oxidase assembly protein subunit 15